jgi:polysaccharide export outer membrane protein
MRLARFSILFLIAVLAAGCARRPAAPVAAARPDLDTLAYDKATRGRATPTVPPAAYAAAGYVAASPTDGPYTLDSGDKLRVIVFGQDGLTNSYGVDAGGSITMPLIGAVKARGLTAGELSSAIAARLRQGYIRDPHVAVEIESYRPFFILGEVNFPGQYPYVANMTVETAVAIAGGFSPRALRSKVEISRPSGGQAVRREVPVGTPVRPGDTIIVAERWF